MWFNQILETGGGINDRELVRALVTHATQTGLWLESLGLKWLPFVYEAWSGKFPRAHQIAGKRCGMEYVRCLARQAQQAGVKVLLNAEVIRLDFQKGRVCGLQYRENGKNDRVVSLVADSVVLACGGFTANQNMRMLYDGRLDESIKTTMGARNLTYDGSTGECIQMAQALGAAVRDMENIQLIPLNGGRLLDYSGGEIFVNSSGERFIDESSEVRFIADAFLRLPDKIMWVITDSSTRKNSSFEQKLLSGTVREASSVADLALSLGVSEAVLRTTLERYNREVDTEVLREDAKPLKQPLRRPPFYFGRERFDVHYCCGGLAITPNGEVLNREKKVIPGLFAAGECTGGIHGKDRMGGDSLISCFVFGRIAGACAASATVLTSNDNEYAAKVAAVVNEPDSVVGANTSASAV